MARNRNSFVLNLIGKIFASIKFCHFKDYKGLFGFKCQVSVLHIFYKISILFLTEAFSYENTNFRK